MQKNKQTQKEQEPPINEFIANLENRWKLENFVSAGLDTEFDSLPTGFRRYASKSEAIVRFNRDIVDATHDLFGLTSIDLQLADDLEAILSNNRANGRATTGRWSSIESH